MRAKRVALIAVAVLVLGALVALGIRRGGREKGTEVYVEKAARRNLSEVVEASGEIEPREKVNISAHVVGKIEKLYVEEGDLIAAGKPFLELEKEAFVAQRDQWAAQLRSSQAAVRRAEANLADAGIRLRRAEKLAADGVLATEQREAVQLQETSARLALDEAREAVLQARASLVKAQDDLGKTTIYAPLSGRVIQLSAEEGEVVVSGTMNNPASVIGVIADLSAILAVVDVDETEIVKIAVGQSAILKVDALPDREYRGKVVEVGSSGKTRPQQPDVTFFAVEVLFEQPDEALRPDMSVRAEIHTAARPDSLAVPIEAVVERPPLAAEETDGKEEEVKVVFVVEEGKARQRPLETGITDETHVEVRSGLTPGEQVVTGPYRVLRGLEDGDAVRIGKPGGDERRKRRAEQDEEEEGEDEEE